MLNIKHAILVAALAVSLAACGGPSGNSTSGNANANANANANTNANKPVAANPAPTKDAIMALEKSGWEAWKTKDAKVFEDLLSDKYVGFGASGRSDKAASIKSVTDPKCEVKSYTLSDDQMTPIGNDVALLTFKADQDYTCSGKKGATPTWSASIYVREGDKWKQALYAETPVTDPKATPPAKPAEAAKKDEAASKPDAATSELVAFETKLWDAWKAKDAKPLEDALGSGFSDVSGSGRMDKAATIKAWTADNKCEVKSVSLTEPMSVSLAKDVSILSYKGGGEGTCEGKPIITYWYVSLDSKQGDAWKGNFNMAIE